MFRFICKELLISSNRDRLISTTIRPNNIWFLQTQSFKSKSESTNEKSHTVPYLVNKFGYSLESATKVARAISIKSVEEANTVVEVFRTYGFTNAHFIKRPSILVTDSNNANILLKFLRAYGFSDAQITASVTKYPSLLVVKPEGAIKPKFEFFKSLGISVPELAKMITKCPSILKRDLDNQIIPSCNFIKTIVHTDEKLVTVLKHSLVLDRDIEELMRPNFLVLRNHGVSEPNIARLFIYLASPLLLKPDVLERNIVKANKFGFDPKSNKFILALTVVAQLSELTWKNKLEAFKNFGMSEDEIISAFILQPLFMKASEKKIMKLMDFYVNSLGFKSSVVSKYPNLMICSLEKRIIPRCSVLQLLLSKGLVEKDVNIPLALSKAGNRFLNQFVFKYQDDIPEVLAAYQGNVEFHGFQN